MDIYQKRSGSLDLVIPISVGHRLMISPIEITKSCDADTSTRPLSPEVYSLRVYR